VTIDSATMMNKGLELVRLTTSSMRPDQIDILVHPQSMCTAWSNTAMAPSLRSSVTPMRFPYILGGPGRDATAAPARSGAAGISDL
jgi:1-deoxy-D-xylulose 5-phosphate reductoisomerase